MIVVMPNCAYLSETTRMIELHRALTEQGVEVAVAAHGGAYLDLLHDEGIEVTVLEPVISVERGRRLVAEGPGLGPKDRSFWTDEELRESALTEAEYLRDIGATAVATGFQLTTLLSGRLADVPIVTTHAGSWVPPVLERRLMPPLAEGGPPLHRLPRSAATWITNAASERLRMHTAGFNRVAEELEVEGVPSFPALLCGDLTLVTEAPEVLGITPDELRAWRPGRRMRPSTRMDYAGPMFARLDRPVPDEVDRFLRSGSRPVTYVAVTSTDEDTVLEAVRGVRAAGHRALVASTLHELSPLHTDDGVLAHPVLPSHEVMPRCDAAVIAGGQGSVQTALASGTPAAAMPLPGQGEQTWNVHVAAQLGAAIPVTRRHLEHEVTQAVRRLSQDESYLAAAKRAAGIYADIDGPTEAASHLAQVAA